MKHELLRLETLYLNAIQTNKPPHTGSNRNQNSDSSSSASCSKLPAATNPLERLQSDASNATIEEQIALGLANPQSSTQAHPGAPPPPVAAKSCLVRGASTKSSTRSKKHVNYSESAEMIPMNMNPISSDQNSLADDDEVFSDSIPPQLPRGDMCAPFMTKRGSMPGLVALPDWFAMEQFREDGGIQEPPVTPVGRDELALKRHRLFSEILQAAQAAVEHRVRFNPWGPQQPQDPLIGNERLTGWVGAFLIVTDDWIARV